MVNRCAASLAIVLPCVFGSASTLAQTATHQLSNGVVEAKVTEDIGGRLVSFGLSGLPNFLRVGNPAAAELPSTVDANAGHVSYNGHEIWAGPQSQWWQHQEVNPGRAAAKSSWPPDPYLSLGKYTLLDKSRHAIELESPASPVSGLQMIKRFALVANKLNSMEHKVSATNRRDKAVAWDIWFNTRVHPATQVYVPVADSADIRVTKVQGMHTAPLVYTLAAGIFSLDVVAPPEGQRSRSGKILLQPAHGWLAGFHDGQAFIIQFPHQPRAAIHPEQGQVELFSDYQPDDLERGLTEMEVHAPYVTLAPGATMQATETWTILPYQGAATRDAHIAFLRQHAKKLGLAVQ